MVSVLLHPYMPSTVDKLLAALGAPEVGVRPRAVRRARAAGLPVEALEPLFPKRLSDVIDSHTHLDCASRPMPSSWRRRPTAGVDADRHGRHRRRVVPGGARRGRGLPAGVRGDRPPPELGHRLRRRGPRRAARARGASTSASRSARPASTTTATTRRAPTRSARSGRRSGSRARPASRWSSTRARPTTTRWRCCEPRPRGCG